MKPADLLREVVFPLTDLTVLVSIVTFGSLLWLTSILLQFGPLFLILGLVFAFFIIPAVFRYATYLLEARAHGRKAIVADVEVFSMFHNLWGIFPLLLLVAMTWIAIYVYTDLGPSATQALVFFFFLVYPASMAVLAITHSPVASISPLSLVRMIKACGVDYVWIPIVLTAVFLCTRILGEAVLPTYVTYLLGTYTFFLLFTLTGAVVNARGVAAEVDIDLPVEKSERAVASDLDAGRQKIADHAYGFISRGNRAGGFKHIRQWISSDPDPDAAVTWFFNEMMRWENKDAALFFGQECFAHYLHNDQDTLALKLASQCMHVDPRWRPGPEDRQHAIELAERYGREDLLASLRR